MIFDAHLHLVHSKTPDFDSLSTFAPLQQAESMPDFDHSQCISGISSSEPYLAITCALSKEEFLLQEKIISSIPKNSGLHYLKSFGIHPQKPDFLQKDFLLELLRENKIDAIGECGFDFYTEEFRSQRQQQEEVWKFQLEAATRYQKPLIIHGRKCTELFFRDIKALKKLPGVIFHSWAGTVTEAKSLLQRGVNAWFSFGKPLLNGKKSAVECVKNLPENRLVFETDAPYQTLKNEEITLPEDILKVYKQAQLIRGKLLKPDLTALFKNQPNMYNF